MPSDTTETRTSISLRTPSKIALLVGLPLLALAVYFYFVPVVVTSSQGSIFGCGSAANPPTDAFPKNVCQNITNINEYRAITSAVAALIIGGLGVALFGVDRKTVERPVRARDEGDDDELDDDDYERGSRGTTRSGARATARRRDYDDD